MDVQAPYLGDSGDGGVAADARGVDGQPAGGGGGGVEMVGIVDSTVSMGNTHPAIGTVGGAGEEAGVQERLGLTCSVPQ